MNESASYAASSAFFTSMRELKNWLRETIGQYDDEIKMEGKSIHDVISEYNEQDPKYAIILDIQYFSYLVNKNASSRNDDNDDTFTDYENEDDESSSSYESGSVDKEE